MNLPPLRPHERDALIKSLRAGVTPRLGARHIQVGRDAEIGALDQDLERIADGGSTFRLLIGEYGSGKTFFLNLVRGAALDRQLVVAHADLNPGRRLQASGGEARSLYAELMKNMATRTKADGGALVTVVEKFITSALATAKKSDRKPEDIIHEQLAKISELVMGYDFATVIAAYWRAYEKDDDALKTSAIRWLRGEFSAKTDARKVLGVREIIDDDAFYDQLKLLARFCRLAGRLQGAADLPRRTGQPLQIAQPDLAQQQLRANPAHPQRPRTRQRRRAGLYLWRHARISH